MFDFFELLYYLIPIAALIFFLVSLIFFCSAKHKNKKCPGTYSSSQMKSRLVCLIVSSVIFGIIALVFIGFILLIMMAVAYM